MTDILNKEYLINKLGTSIFSTNLFLYQTIDSTNRVAKKLALEGAPEGTVILAEKQTAGRGRMARQWLSPKYSNILVSLLLRPIIPEDQVFALTMIMALATIDSMKQKSRLDPMIKWPNDIYIGYKKLGGILTEFSIKHKHLEHVIIGLGLNVNWNPEKQDGLLYQATSILAETGQRISRMDLLSEILLSFEFYYREIQSHNLENVYDLWNKHSLVMGQTVTIELPEQSIQGKVLRIDRLGGLVILDDQGGEQTILSGDVSIKMERT